MTLRARLAVTLALVVLVPLLAGVLLSERAVRASSESVRIARLDGAAGALSALLEQTCGRLLGEADRLASSTPPERAARASALGVAGDAVGSTGAAGRPGLRAGIDDPAAVGGCAGRPVALRADGSTLLAAVLPSEDGVVAVGVRLDDRRAALLAAVARTDVVLVVGGRAAGSSLPPAATSQLTGRPEGLTSEGTLFSHRSRVVGSPGLAVVAVLPRPPDPVPLPVPVVFTLAALLAGITGVALSRLLTRPLGALGAAAERVAAGDLEAPIPASGDEAVDRVASALTEVTEDLRRHVDALEQSRTALRTSLGRLGDTLSGTHDLGKILSVSLESAVDAVGSRAGAVLLSSGRSEMAIRAATGLEGRLPAGTAPTDVRVPLGLGIAGRVAEEGVPLRGSLVPGPGALVADEREPLAADVIAVPLINNRGVIGVLCLYERRDGRPFDDDDLGTLETFARQAAVAVDNVLLHQEAERLSLTDGLTGLWNRRYFQMALTRETERAVRFHRPLSLLMLDLDRFKAVNDTHGHQRGDAVLVELSARLSAVTRDVDTLARYGGEEFVLLLPETDATGAEQAAARILEVVRAEAFAGPLAGPPTGPQGGPQDTAATAEVGRPEVEQPLHLTVSVGAAVLPHSAPDGRSLVRAADEALYAAKGGGRDAYRIAPVLPAAG